MRPHDDGRSVNSFEAAVDAAGEILGQTDGLALDHRDAGTSNSSLEQQLNPLQPQILSVQAPHYQPIPVDASFQQSVSTQNALDGQPPLQLLQQSQAPVGPNSFELGDHLHVNLIKSGGINYQSSSNDCGALTSQATPTTQHLADQVQHAMMSLSTAAGHSQLSRNSNNSFHLQSRPPQHGSFPSSFATTQHQWSAPASLQHHDPTLVFQQQGQQQQQQHFEPGIHWGPSVPINTNDRGISQFHDYQRISQQPSAISSAYQQPGQSMMQPQDLATSQAMQGFNMASQQLPQGNFDMDQQASIQGQNVALLQQYMMMSGLVPTQLHQYQDHVLFEGRQQQQQHSQPIPQVAAPDLAFPAPGVPNVWTVPMAATGQAELNQKTREQAAGVVARRGRGRASQQASDAGSVQVRVRKRRRYRHESFPSKLYRILEEVEQNGAQDIVSFTFSGTAFAINNALHFTNQILPKYFRHGRMASFKRQLSMYGFRRLTSGSDEGAFYHPLFRKGQPELCLQLKRVTEFEVLPTKVDGGEPVDGVGRSSVHEQDASDVASESENVGSGGEEEESVPVVSASDDLKQDGECD